MLVEIFKTMYVYIFESIEMYEAKIPISTNLTWPATCLFIFIALTLFIHFE